MELHAKSIHGKSLDDLKRQVKRPQSSPNKRRKYNSKSKKKRKKSYTSDEESDTEVSEEESGIEEVVEIKKSKVKVTNKRGRQPKKVIA